MYAAHLAVGLANVVIASCILVAWLQVMFG
jgi:hypothetical protein